MKFCFQWRIPQTKIRRYSDPSSKEYTLFVKNWVMKTFDRTGKIYGS
ncbi:5716_t:CDS:2 [Funneliformis caledonium]|uniref:5716_t:CDS:1 n=1 Tax=Funneliformis caledonium TaxID=1117310 RepID=A0A9N8W3D3_9GLOM|nr:5716_t:CDS:2 [Funneliformis caledonium]